MASEIEHRRATECAWTISVVIRIRSVKDRHSTVTETVHYT